MGAGMEKTETYFSSLKKDRQLNLKEGMAFVMAVNLW